MEGFEALMVGAQNVMDEATKDPRFDTIFKRICWFQGDKTDEEFAELIGVTLRRFRRWKRGQSLIENQRLDTGLAIADRLDVHPSWLIFGDFHRVRMLPDGKRLTSFYRFRPFWQFTDSPNSEETRASSSTC